MFYHQKIIKNHHNILNNFLHNSLALEKHLTHLNISFQTTDLDNFL